MFDEVTFGELIGERSDRIPSAFPHLFSTRSGGVSSLPFLKSLNIGENRGDDPENVAENYRRLLATVGRRPDQAVIGHQVHSCNVRIVTSADGGRFFEDTDGFVTASRGVALTVKIADCLPILLCDPEAGVIAALHAGWRGSAGKIAAVGVQKMVGLGAAPERIVAAVGASIHSCCYEVQEDFVDALTRMAGERLARETLVERSGRRFADLPRLNREILLESGLSEDHIDLCPHCTCCRPDRYFSHRASGGIRGTMAATITVGDAFRKK